MVRKGTNVVESSAGGARRHDQAIFQILIAFCGGHHLIVFRDRNTLVVDRFYRSLLRLIGKPVPFVVGSGGLHTLCVPAAESIATWPTAAPTLVTISSGNCASEVPEENP